MTCPEYREFLKRDVQPVSYKKRLEARQKAAAEKANDEEHQDDENPPQDQPKPASQVKKPQTALPIILLLRAASSTNLPSTVKRLRLLIYGSRTISSQHR